MLKRPMPHLGRWSAMTMGWLYRCQCCSRHQIVSTLRGTMVRMAPFSLTSRPGTTQSAAASAIRNIARHPTSSLVRVRRSTFVQGVKNIENPARSVGNFLVTGFLDYGVIRYVGGEL